MIEPQQGRAPIGRPSLLNSQLDSMRGSLF